MTMGVLELVIAVCLILPAIYKPLAILTPIAAICIAVEMLAFTALHISSGNGSFGPIVYWLVVAALSAFVAYGRLVPRPL
jgi:hypothetical protein